MGYVYRDKYGQPVYDRHGNEVEIAAVDQDKPKRKPPVAPEGCGFHGLYLKHDIVARIKWQVTLARHDRPKSATMSKVVNAVLGKYLPPVGDMRKIEDI